MLFKNKSEKLKRFEIFFIFFEILMKFFMSNYTALRPDTSSFVTNFKVDCGI